MASFTPDETIWEYAKVNDFAIVTADSDFLALADSRGTPPRVVHLEKCNYRTLRVEELMIRRHAIPIAEMGQSSRPTLVVRSTA
jgi:predicted nuclease of predicted toxin-antitoxin system